MYSPRTGDGRASVPPNARDLSSSMPSDHVLERPYRERLVKRDWSLDRLSVRREPSVNSSSSLPTSSKRYSLGRHGENGRFGSPGDPLLQETGASYRRSERDFSYGAASRATRDYPDSWETNTSSGQNKDGSYLTEHCCRHLDPSDSKMKGTNAGWDSSFKEEREIKDRAHFKQDFRRRVSHFDSAYDWDNKGGGRLDRYGVGHRESLIGDSLADGRDLPSYDRVSSLPTTLSIRRSPQSSPRSFPFASANDSAGAGVCSPAKTRPRLGWGQGLAKYEKKKVEADNGQNVLSNGNGPSNAAGNDDTCPFNEGKSSPPSSSPLNARTLTSPGTNNDWPEEVAPEAEEEVQQRPLSPERDHRSGSVEIPAKEQEVVSYEAAPSLSIQSGTILSKEAILLEVEKVESEIDSIEREIAAFCVNSEEDVSISSIEGVGKIAESDSVGRHQQSPSQVPENCLEVPESQAAEGFVNINLESSDLPEVLHLQKERTLGFVVNVLEENQRKAKLGAQSFAHLLPRGIDYIAGETYSQAPAWHANREVFNKQKARMQQKISDLSCLLRMKERVLLMKYQALKEFWKREQLGIGQKREKILRNGFKSSLRLRPMCGGSLKSDASHEEVQIKTIPSEVVAGRVRGSLKMPAMILGDKEKFFRKFITNNGLVEDPIALEQERKMINPWSPEEKKIFLEKFAVFNKNFSKIASYLEHKTTAECVEFYYRNHKSEEFDKIRRKQQVKKRRDYSRGSASYLATTTPTSRHREAAAARLQEQNLTFSSGSARDAMRFTKTVTQKVGERGRPGFCAEYGRSELLTAGKSSAKENKAANGLLLVAGMLTSSTAGSCTSARSFHGKHSSKGAQCIVGGSETEHVACPKGVYWRRDSTEEVDSQWTDRERLLFTDAVGLYGKDFKSIAQHVGSKGVGQCKAFFSKTRKRFGLDKIVQQRQNASQSTLDLEAKPPLEIETPEVCAELKAEPCELSYSDLKGSSCSQEKTQNTPGVGLDEIQVDEHVQNCSVVTCSSSHQLAVVDENVAEAVKDVVQVAHDRELKVEDIGGLAEGIKVDEKGHRKLEENTVSEIKAECFVKEEPGTRTYVGKPVVSPTTEEDGQKEKKRLKLDPDLSFMATAVSSEVNNGHTLPAMVTNAAPTNTGSNIQGREKVAKINSAGEPKPRREPTSWTQEEKEIFAEIIKKHGKDWNLLHESLPSKSLTQIKTYFQNSKAKLGFASADGVGTCARGANARKRKAEDFDISSTSGAPYVGAENLAYALFGQNAGQAVEGTACIADVQKFLRQMCANGYAPQTASSTAPSPLFTSGSLPILASSSSSLQQPFAQSSKQPHGPVSISQQALSSQVIQQQQQLAMPPMVAHKTKLANQLQQQQAAAQVASLTQKHLQTEVAHHLQQQIAHHQQQQAQQLQQQALSQLHHQASKVVIQQQQLQQAMQQQSSGACQLHQHQQQQPSHQAIQQLNQQQHLLSHSIISQQKAEQQSIIQQQAQSLLQQKHLLVQQQKALQPQVLCHPNELLHQQQLQAVLQKQEEILSKLKQQSSLLLVQDRQQLGKQVTENPFFMVQSEQAPNPQQIISQQQQQFLQGMHIHFSKQQESSLGQPLHLLKASRSGPELSKCDSANKVLASQEESHDPQAAADISKVEVAESQSIRGSDVKLFGQSLLSQPTGPLTSVKTCLTPGGKHPLHQECSSLALPVSSIRTTTSCITKEPSACRPGVPFLLADGSWSSVPSTKIGGHQAAVTIPGDEHTVHEAVSQMTVRLAQREPVILSNRPHDQQRVMQGCFRNEAVVNGGKSQSDQLNGSLELITGGAEREPLLARATGQSFGLPLASMQGTQALSNQGLSCAVMDVIMRIAGWQNPHAANSQGDVHRELDNASTGSGLPGRTVPYNQSHLCGPDILQHIRESLYLPPSQLLNLSGHAGINSSAWATTGGLATASDLQRVLASQFATFQTRNPATVEDVGRPDDVRELNDGGKAG